MTIKKYSFLFSILLLSVISFDGFSETKHRLTTDRTPPKAKVVHQSAPEAAEAATLFDPFGSIKKAAKKVGSAIKKGGQKAFDTTKKIAQKVGSTTKKVAYKVGSTTKNVASKGFKLAKNTVKNIHWKEVMQKGLKIAVPTLKGCAAGVVGSLPAAFAAGSASGGTAGVAIAATACGMGALKAGMPATLGVIHEAMTNKQKKNALSEEIKKNKEDIQKIDQTINQAQNAKNKLKTKEEKEAADFAIQKAQEDKKHVQRYVNELNKAQGQIRD